MLRKTRQVRVLDYDKIIIPQDYSCDACTSKGVRLWREFDVAASKTRLLCTSCVEKDQKQEHKVVWKSPCLKGHRDQIGCFIPAIPEQNSHTYWGRDFVPKDAIKWWNNLPLEK